MQKRTTRAMATRLGALAAGMSLLAAGCGGDDDAITVGSKEFGEQQLLGHMAMIALEDAGYDVQSEIPIQGTSTVRSALESGDVSLYWEYTGTGWNEILGHEVADAPDDPQALFEAVKEEDAGNDITWLDPAEANNTYAIATSAENAQRLGVRTLSDYADLVNSDPDEATLCAAAEFLDRDDGWPGVESTYGFELPGDAVNEMDLDVIYTRVPGGDPCNFGEVFATDGRIAGNDLVVLEDDQETFVAYNVAMTIRADILDEHPGLADVFGPITELLTNDVLLELNTRVDVDEEDAEDVAREFLESNGLLNGGDGD